MCCFSCLPDCRQMHQLATERMHCSMALCIPISKVFCILITDLYTMSDISMACVAGTMRRSMATRSSMRRAPPRAGSHGSTTMTHLRGGGRARLACPWLMPTCASWHRRVRHVIALTGAVLVQADQSFGWKMKQDTVPTMLASLYLTHQQPQAARPVQRQP